MSIDLKHLIDLQRIECLNADLSTSARSIIEDTADGTTSGGVLRSDVSVDSQLLFKITFRESVKIKSLRLLVKGSMSSNVEVENEQGHTESGPKTVKLFVNQANVSFADADSLPPTETLLFTAQDLANENEKMVKFTKYQNVQTLTLYFVDNQTESEVTVLHRITMLGVPIEATRPMSELKKVEEH